MKYFWTEEQDALLISKYPNTKTKELSILLGKSMSSIHCRAHELGVPKYKYKGKEKVLRRKVQKIRSSAKERGLEFSLEESFVIEVIQNNCFYCGRPPKNTLSNGLDRQNSAVGYIMGNVVACCKVCNMGKNELTVQEYIEHCARVLENLGRI